MPITPSVLFRASLRARLVAVVAVGGALALGVGPTAPAAAARPLRSPATSSRSDPASRIAELSALVAQRDRAVVDAQARRDETAAALTTARQSENLALARADQLSRIADAAQQRYQIARDRAGAVAAAVYREAGQPELLVRLLTSHSPTEFGYRKSLTDRVGAIQAQVVRKAVRARREAVSAAAEADRAKLGFHRQVVTLQAELPRRDQALGQAQDARSRASFWLSRWQSVALGADTPIMSRSVLSPSELAAWFSASHRRARITVPMSELAADYIAEGEAAGVRGDIAFAQSILETGSFFFPDGGQLTPADNNFAGINACDSCAHGSPFPDARTGVRAQMQLLRVYADPSFSSASLGEPTVLADLDHHFLKGRVRTWNGLTHTWATADAYGTRIVAIYTQILGWLTDRADI